MAASWRWIVSAVTLTPALLVLSWSLRQAAAPRTDPVLVGHSPDESRRLQRILNDPPADVSTPLRDDAIHVLATVTDNTFGVPNAEKSAYELFLAQARDVPHAELERAARKDVSFAVLMLNAEHYRGELLTVTGEVRRLRQLPAEPNSPETYEAWLFTPDSGRHPYRIIFTSRPEGVALADQLNPPLRASATGYFFKRYSYATANSFHTAPLLLAKTLIPLSQSAGKTANGGPNRSRMLTIAAIGVVAFVCLVWLTIEAGNRRPRHKPSNSVSEDHTSELPDFSAIGQPPD
jgi:hypothetical protein